MGHVMNEKVGQQEWRSSVRGQCFSFVMPWAQMIREYSARMSRDDLGELPRGEDCLQYLFRIHLKVAGQSFASELRQVRLRPCVLIHLLVFLYNRRPDLFRQQMPAAAALARRVEEVVTEVVHRKYPEQEGHLPEYDRQGFVPAPFVDMQEGSEEAPGSKRARRFIVTTKHATPGPGPASSVEEAVEYAEPRCCILDANPNVCNSEQDMRSAAIAAFRSAQAGAAMEAEPTGRSQDGSEEHSNMADDHARTSCREADLHLQTGYDLQHQWDGTYLCKAMPFTIPRLVSGPDFSKKVLGGGMALSSAPLPSYAAFRGEWKTFAAQTGLPCLSFAAFGISTQRTWAPM